MISASHNPFPDNGIKLFGRDGFKLDDADEDRVVELIEQGELPTGAALGESVVAAGRGSALRRLGGRRPSVAPCGRGGSSSTARTAPRASSRAGCSRGSGSTPELCFASPDGLNINERCGSTYLEALSEGVVSGGYELGLAFDGDADRMLAVTAAGLLVDGDQIVAILARDLLARHALPGSLVVRDLDVEPGLPSRDAELGIETVVTDVGDRYVLEAMRARGAALGGEQSGHVIALGYQTTGDGLVTSALLLAALDRAGQTLEQAAGLVTRFPQRLVNIRADREGLADARAIWELVRARERRARGERRRARSSCARPAPSRSCA